MQCTLGPHFGERENMTQNVDTELQKKYMVAYGSTKKEVLS